MKYEICNYIYIFIIGYMIIKYRMAGGGSPRRTALCSPVRPPYSDRTVPGYSISISTVVLLQYSLSRSSTVSMILYVLY